MKPNIEAKTNLKNSFILEVNTLSMQPYKYTDLVFGNLLHMLLNYMYTTYILLGSNLGNSKKFLSDAILEIEYKLGTISSKSSLYQTASWGKHDQPDFINQVIELKTSLSPADLLKAVLEIENVLGRQRLEKWGSRTIDIDILLYEDQIINTPDLIVPHPYLSVRRFSLMPLFEIAPNLVHPISRKSITELLCDLTDNLFVKKLS
jgi:2-amino-4-hydroxy-6-hydroxymethyldihydropteridine diphosphokinase